MFRSIPEAVTREWFDTEQVGPIAFALPEPDIDYAYAAARLLSWYPVVNSKGATYYPEDVDEELLSTLIGKQANLQHDKTRIIGTIFAAQKTDEGIDIGVRIDRECANLQGLDMVEMRSGNYFSHVSVELTKDPDLSWFYAIDDEYNVVQKIPVTVGKDLNIRRTTKNDPFKLMGNRVVERIKPARFTGVGFVPNPADKTAALYAVAASEDSEDKEKPIPSELTGGEQQSASTDELPEKEIATVNEAELKARIEALEADVARLTSEKEQASSDATSRVAEIQAQLDAAKTALTEKETELASVTAERDTLKTEKETAAREAAIDALVGELVAIHPAKDDAELASLRETAQQAVGDNGVIRVLKLERENVALKAQLEAKTAPAPAAGEETPAGGETTPEGGKDGETASEETPVRSNPPKVSIGGQFTGTSNGASLSKEELLANF